MAVAGGVGDPLVLRRGLRGVKAARNGIAHAAKAENAVVLEAADAALGGLGNGKIAFVAEALHGHSSSIVNARRRGPRRLFPVYMNGPRFASGKKPLRGS